MLTTNVSQKATVDTNLWSFVS